MWIVKRVYLQDGDSNTYVVGLYILFCKGDDRDTSEDTWVDSRYLEVQGTVWNTSRYPYLDI